MSSYWTKRRKLHANVDIELAKIAQENAAFEAHLVNPQLQGNDQLDQTVNEPSSSQQTDHNSIDVRIMVPPEERTDSSRSDSESDSSYSDDEDQVGPVDDSDKFANRLAECATQYAVSLNALQALLGILRERYPELPKDPRTLLGTLSTSVTQHNIHCLSGGTYYHFGIANGIKLSLEQITDLNILDALTIQVNVDGLPVFKSTNSQFWPIQGMLDLPTFTGPFLIGLFYGKS